MQHVLGHIFALCVRRRLGRKNCYQRKRKMLSTFREGDIGVSLSDLCTKAVHILRCPSLRGCCRMTFLCFESLFWNFFITNLNQRKPTKNMNENREGYVGKLMKSRRYSSTFQASDVLSTKIWRFRNEIPPDTNPPSIESNEAGEKGFVWYVRRSKVEDTTTWDTQSTCCARHYEKRRH